MVGGKAKNLVRNASFPKKLQALQPELIQDFITAGWWYLRFLCFRFETFF